MSDEVCVCVSRHLQDLLSILVSSSDDNTLRNDIIRSVWFTVATAILYPVYTIHTCKTHSYFMSSSVACEFMCSTELIPVQTASEPDAACLPVLQWLSAQAQRL